MRVWLIVLALMIIAGIVKTIAAAIFAVPGMIAVDVLLFVVIYLWLKRQRYVAIKLTLLIVGAMTIVNILEDLAIIGGLTASIILLVVIVYMIWRSHRRPRPPQMRHQWHK